MRERFRRIFGSAMIGTLLFLFGISRALADWELNMTKGVSPISQDTFSLHMTIFWICVAIATVVFTAMIYALYTFRRSRGSRPDTSMVHSTKLELIWTIIPIGILVAIAIPAAESLIKIEDTRAPDVTIKVTGYQWKWHYEYLGGPDDAFIQNNFGFFSNISAESNRARQLKSGVDVFEVDHYLRDVDQRMVVPVDRKVRILLTSNDVLHAWWVPELGGKRDAIPGFVNEMWFQAEEIGVYRGQCAELCGRDHGFMPIVVEVLSEVDFAQWVEQQGGGGAAAAAHDDDSTDSGIVQEPLAEQIGQVPNDKPGTTMAALAYLSDTDIAEIITDEGNARGNDTGDVIQPADIRAAR